MDIYQTILRPLFFTALKTDPERLHIRSLRLLDWLNQQRQKPLGEFLIRQLDQTYSWSQPSLQQTLWGLEFANPIGLAAGFDKDGVAAGIWPHFGFGFAEMGTVTFHAQPGNPQPRLFRLPLDQAVLNRMGFNNQGAAALADRLVTDRLVTDRLVTDRLVTDRLVTNGLDRRSAIGINLGKSKITPLETAAEDYLASFRLLKTLGDYFVVNVSSPNTPGLRSLQASDQLAPILAALQQENSENKPLLVKIAPDLEWDAIAAVVDLAQSHHLAGIIATNTTIRRDQLQTKVIEATGQLVTAEAGGISGMPMRSRSTEVIRSIYQQTQGTLPIIGVGGVFTAADAWEKITAGASLVQTYTGWIYEGPWMVKRILQGIAQNLAEQGFSHISEAVGSQAKP